jgi:hypothetical protein
MFISLKNKTLNNLYIIDEFNNEGRWYVDCLCVCGNKCTKLKFHVQSGGTKSELLEWCKLILTNKKRAS